jgi:hypothetical protein
LRTGKFTGGRKVDVSNHEISIIHCKNIIGICEEANSGNYNGAVELTRAQWEIYRTWYHENLASSILSSALFRLSISALESIVGETEEDFNCHVGSLYNPPGRSKSIRKDLQQYPAPRGLGATTLVRCCAVQII